jgi:Domain of unknown function (DUF4062)
MMKFTLMAKVFLSSTCDDLDQLGYRAKALHAINQRQLTPESMEFWETRPQPSVQKCLEKVRASDLLVVVVAFRYGWIPPGQKAPDRRSITWMEVEEARRKPIPIVPFFAAKEDGPLWQLGERYRLSKAKTDAEFEDLIMRARLLDKFKETFSGIDIGQFESPDDLLHKIYRALEPWDARSVRQKKLIDDRAYLNSLHEASRHIEIPGISRSRGTRASGPGDRLVNHALDMMLLLVRFR